MKLSLSQEAKDLVLGLLVTFSQNSKQGRGMRRMAMRTANKFMPNSTKPSVSPKERVFVYHMTNIAEGLLKRQVEELNAQQEKSEEATKEVERLERDLGLLQEARGAMRLVKEGEGAAV